MGSNENGLKQSPFTDAWATPDVGGTGLNGIGGGLDPDPGSVGTIQSPFKEAIVPTPGMEATPCAELGIPHPKFVRVTGGADAGSLQPSDGVSTKVNTIDKQ